LKVQNPAPPPRLAWWLPPAPLQAMPNSSASSAASSVPAVASRARRETPFVDRKADLAFHRVRHLAGDHLLDIAPAMGKRQEVGIGRLGAKDAGAIGDACLFQHLHQPAIFAHREAVIGGEFRVVIGMVDDRQMHRRQICGGDARKAKGVRSILGLAGTLPKRRRHCD
jgi:hypothetical protein